MTALSEKIRAAVDTSGLTAREVAKRGGWDESTVSLWISGGRTPRVQNLKKLAEILGTEATYFWSGPEAVPANPVQSAMIDEMSQLDPVQQEALLALARTMRHNQG